MSRGYTLTNQEDKMPLTRIRRYLRHGTFPQLSVLEAVIRRGNFTRAAEELYMAQPTVSIQLKKLSEMVGLPLVEQIGRQVHPTEAGRYVAQACETMFEALTRLEAQLDNLREMKGGQMRIAVSTSAKYFAPRLLAEFARVYPEVELSLRIHHRETLLSRMSANEDDLYILANPPEGGEFVKQAILPNPLAVFARADHPLAGEKRISLERIAQEPFLMREPGSGTRLSVQRLFQEHDLIPKVRMELSSDEAIKQAIIAGMGVSILPRHTLGVETDQPQLTTLDVEDIPTDGHWYLVYPLGKQLTPATMAFMDLVRREARKLLTGVEGTVH